jgi:phosphate transport system substrate-binding protein
MAPMVRRLAQDVGLLALLALPAGFLLLLAQDFAKNHHIFGTNTLNAGGATIIYPMMAKWASEYNKTKGVEVAYASNGSGAGKAQMIEKTLDFGCSDAALTDEEMAKFRTGGGDVIHVPLAMGAVVPIYNLRGIDQPVRFTGPVLADIYLGKINRWNDPRLLELQEPDLPLPDKPIWRVHRADATGTARLFTEYLANSSPQWKNQVGTGSTVKWPATSSGGIG